MRKEGKDGAVRGWMTKMRCCWKGLSATRSKQRERPVSSKSRVSRQSGALDWSTHMCSAVLNSSRIKWGATMGQGHLPAQHLGALMC